MTLELIPAKIQIGFQALPGSGYFKTLDEDGQRELSEKARIEIMERIPAKYLTEWAKVELTPDERGFVTEDDVRECLQEALAATEHDDDAKYAITLTDTSAPVNPEAVRYCWPTPQVRVCKHPYFISFQEKANPSLMRQDWWVEHRGVRIRIFAELTWSARISEWQYGEAADN